jgi:hypothetical protein
LPLQCQNPRPDEPTDGGYVMLSRGSGAVLISAFFQHYRAPSLVELNLKSKNEHPCILL